VGAKGEGAGERQEWWLLAPTIRLARDLTKRDVTQHSPPPFHKAAGGSGGNGCGGQPPTRRGGNTFVEVVAAR
jgi:hypothetical protein